MSDFEEVRIDEERLYLKKRGFRQLLWGVIAREYGIDGDTLTRHEDLTFLQTSVIIPEYDEKIQQILDDRKKKRTIAKLKAELKDLEDEGK